MCFGVFALRRKIGWEFGEWNDLYIVFQMYFQTKKAKMLFAFQAGLKILIKLLLKGSQALNRDLNPSCA